MLNKFFLSCFFFIISCVATIADAVEVDDLYRQTVAVSDQSLKSRKQAYKDTLASVLVRVSGLKSVLHNSVIQKAIKNPTKYLSRYAFDSKEGNSYIEVEFNPSAVNTLLREQDFPIWGSQRPLVLAWVAVERQGERQLISEESVLYATDIKPKAQARGLPLILPIIDFEDHENIKVSDIWGQFEQHIWQASQRYKPDLVANIKLYKIEQALLDQVEANVDIFNAPANEIFGDANIGGNSNKRDGEMRFDSTQLDATSENVPDNKQVWVASLVLIGGRQSEVYRSSGHEAMLDSLQESIDWVADTLGKQYAVEAQRVTTENNTLYLTFANLSTMTEVINIENFLANLAAVSSVKVKSINHVGLTYELSLLGEAVDVINALDLDERIEIIKPSFDEPLPVAHYLKWKGANLSNQKQER